MLQRPDLYCDVGGWAQILRVWSGALRVAKVAHGPSEGKATLGPSSGHKADPSLQRGTQMVTSHSASPLALDPTSLSSPAPQ